MILPETEDLTMLIKEWKEKYSPEELKSIIGFIKDPVNKLIAEKILLGDGTSEMSPKTKNKI